MSRSTVNTLTGTTDVQQVAVFWQTEPRSYILEVSHRLGSMCVCRHTMSVQFVATSVPDAGSCMPSASNMGVNESSNAEN